MMLLNSGGKQYLLQSNKLLSEIMEECNRITVAKLCNFTTTTLSSNESITFQKYFC